MIRKINGITYNPPADYGDTATTSVGTTETILNSVLVPGNTFGRGDIVGVQTRIRKTTTNSTINLRLRIGTTLNTSQTQVGIFTSSSSAYSYIPFDRRLSIQSQTTDTRVLFSTTSYVSDYAGLFPSDMSSLSIDWTVDNYIIITGQTTTSTDTLNCGYIYLDLIQPDA